MIIFYSCKIDEFNGYIKLDGLLIILLLLFLQHF